MRIVTNEGHVIEDVPEELVMKLLEKQMDKGKKSDKYNVEFTNPSFQKPKRKYIRHVKRKHQHWTAQEDKYIRQNYAKLGARRVGKDLGRSAQSIYMRLARLEGRV